MPARPSAPGTGHTVDDCRRARPGRRPERRLHLGRGHVLALPAVGVADAVDEIIEAARIARASGRRCDTRQSPGLNTSRRTLRFGGLRVGIALEAAGSCGLRRPGSVRSPRRPRRRRSADRSPSASRARLAGRDVELQQRNGESVREKRRDPADRARLAFAVVQRKIAFGGRVIFEDPRDAKAALKVFQTSGRRPLPQAMRSRCSAFARCCGAIDQIAAKLADVLEQRAALARVRRARTPMRRSAAGSRPRRHRAACAPVATTPPTL